METGRRATVLLGLPVRLNGIALGRPADLVVDLEGMRAVGLEVACPDASTRFLPLAAARLREDEIEVGSPLLLLDDDRFYRERGRKLASLRGLPVERSRRHVGVLADVVVGADGAITSLLVDSEAGEQAIRVHGAVRVRADADPRRAA